MAIFAVDSTRRTGETPVRCVLRYWSPGRLARRALRDEFCAPPIRQIPERRDVRHLQLRGSVEGQRRPFGECLGTRNKRVHSNGSQSREGVYTSSTPESQNGNPG